MHEIVACCVEFVETLVCKQHLAQSIVAVGPSPWSLDGRDVSRLGNGRAKSCRGTEFTDLMRIMSKRVLTRKVEAFRSHSMDTKTFSIFVKSPD